MIQEITQYIENNTDLEIGVDLFSAFVPSDAPDDCVAILETVPGVPNFYLTDYVEKPIQVISRASNYYVAKLNVEAIYSLLHGATGITLPNVIGNEYYVNTAEANAAPYSIGVDDRGLHQIVVNFILRIQNV